MRHNDIREHNRIREEDLATAPKQTVEFYSSAKKLVVHSWRW